MSIRFLFDEHLRGVQWHAFVRKQLVFSDLEGTRVGDPLDLPLGTQDSDILLWAERNEYILVSADANTMPRHLAAHLAAGHHLPGLFLVGRNRNLDAVIDYLTFVHQASDPEEWRDIIHWVRA